MSAHISAEHLVIGSSPLMLLQALYLAHSNQSVYVIERPHRMGGSWSTSYVQPLSFATDDCHPYTFKTENACHLIESFPGVYLELERLSGVRFTPLADQPIRIIFDRFQIPYHSRLLSCLSLLHLLLGFILTFLLSVLSRTSLRERYINYYTKLRSFLRFQLPLLFTQSKIFAPEFGYAHFIATLIHRCRESGITFISGDVNRLSFSEDSWHVNLIASDYSISARRVHLTTATNLRLTSPTELVSVPTKPATRRALVVKIRKSSISKAHSYVAIWPNKKISRISRIDLPAQDESYDDSFVHYLVELRRPVLDSLTNEDIVSFLTSQFVRLSILRHGSSLTLIGFVSCNHIYNVDQLKRGTIAHSLFTYYSQGNLAAGIAEWIHQRRPPS